VLSHLYFQFQTELIRRAGSALQRPARMFPFSTFLTLLAGKFILITSASHMARSMALFQSKGMNPIPAPTGYHVEKIQKISPTKFSPVPRGLTEWNGWFTNI